MNTTTVALPEELNIDSQVAELKQRTVQILARAREIEVGDQDTFLEVCELGKAAKEGEDYAESIHRPVVAYFDKLHRNACAALKEVKNPFTEAKQLCSKKADQYVRDQEKKRLEEERRLQELARKQEEERRLREAAELEKEGHHELASEVLQEAIETPPVAVVLPRPTPKVAGAVHKKTYHAEVTDLMKLVKAVAAGRIPIHYVQANMQQLNATAKNMGENMNIDGVKAVPDGGMSFGGRR